MLSFKNWFTTFPRWDTIGWLVVIGVGAALEISGAAEKNLTTFTNLVRHTVPVWARGAILAVLFWHFCLAAANFK